MLQHTFIWFFKNTSKGLQLISLPPCSLSWQNLISSRYTLPCWLFCFKQAATLQSACRKSVKKQSAPNARHRESASATFPLLDWLNASLNAADASHNESDAQPVRWCLRRSSRMKRLDPGVKDGLAAVIGEDKSCCLEFSQAFVTRREAAVNRLPLYLFLLPPQYTESFAGTYLPNLLCQQKTRQTHSYQGLIAAVHNVVSRVRFLFFFFF